MDTSNENRLPHDTHHGVFVAAMALSAFVGYLDYFTGWQIAFTLFYLLPISLTWYLGRTQGLIIALLSGLFASSTEYLWNIPYEHPVTPYWNSFSRVTIFIVISLLISKLRSTIDSLEDNVYRRTRELHEKIHQLELTEQDLQTNKNALEREIREREAAQQRLNDLNDSLEQRIAGAVSELRQKDELLLQQTRLAAMGELLTIISHQWRQPLNNIAIYLQSLKLSQQAGELTPDELDQKVDSAVEILQDLSGTIDDFRRFFRKDTERCEFIVKEAIEHSVGIVKPSLAANNIKIAIYGDGKVRAVGYPNDYAQCIINILCNSQDILVDRNVSDPYIEIIISKANGKSIVTVYDNGGGIADDVMPHIFKPYFTTKGPASGSGIGLYMAQTLITRNMGGSLTVKNIDKGALFLIEL